jgi:hypothetical protein
MDIEEQQIGEEVHYTKQKHLNVNFMLMIQDCELKQCKTYKC